MKKALYISSIMFLLGIVYAQDWTSSTTPSDTVFIRLNVKMIGPKWSLDTLADGWDDELDAVMPPWNFISDADLDTHAAIQAAGDSVHPCDDIIGAFWLENVGGITLDFETCYKSVGPLWTIHATAYDCAGAFGALPGTLNASALVFNYLAADGVPDDFAATDPDANDVVTNTYRELNNTNFAHPTEPYPYATASGVNLYAEDPFSLGDGVFANQTDQLELYYNWIMPATSTTSDDQTVLILIRGAVAAP